MSQNGSSHESGYYYESMLVSAAINASLSAGKKILNRYNSAYKVQYKDDHSPVTEADYEADIEIRKILKETTPEFEIFSEEGEMIKYKERSKWQNYWLIDPLDGTKEFIAGSKDFCVNVAFIQNNIPMIGVIFLPAHGLLYVGSSSEARCIKLDSNFLFTESLSLPLRKSNSLGHAVILISKSSFGQDIKDFINNIKNVFGKVEIIARGSALKLCLLAEGSADFYPRFGPTMEWDTAAGDAILRRIGGGIFNMKYQDRLEYNKANLNNPDFLGVSSLEVLRYYQLYLNKSY